MSHHPLTPAARHLLEKIRQAGFPPIHTLPIEQARMGYLMSVQTMATPGPALARVEDFSLPTPHGVALRARLWSDRPRDDARPQPVLLYLHGGGFVIGSIETCEAMCRQIAQASGAAVVAIDYRLAPEHKFPAPFVDCFAALDWLAAQAATLGLDAGRIAVGGDSAGGTLAAACALHARDRGLPLALQVLIYPSVQTSQLTESLATYSRELLLSRELMAWFDQQYEDPATPFDWRRQPLRAASHAGVAPAWIGLAECDALADDGRLYAQALQAAGVPVQLRIWPGVIHDFINMGRFLPEAAELHGAVAQALKDAFAQPG